MSMHAFAAALTIALVAPPPFPFPAPRAVQVTEKTKCDTGTLLSVDRARGQIRATTPAGIVTYKVGADARVFDAKGTPLAGLGTLSPGRKARIYYLVEDGAKVSEIDLE